MSTFYTYVSPVSIKWISIVGPLVLVKKQSIKSSPSKALTSWSPPDKYDARLTSQRANHMQYSKSRFSITHGWTIRHYLELAILLFYPALIRLFLDPLKAAGQKMVNTLPKSLVTSDQRAVAGLVWSHCSRQTETCKYKHKNGPPRPMFRSAYMRLYMNMHMQASNQKV